MKLYWSVHKLPELEGKDKREVMVIWREAVKRANKDPKYLSVFLIAGLGAGIGSLFGLVGAGVGGGIGAIVLLPFMYHAARPHVAAAVLERQNRITIGEDN